jgi:transposase
MPLTRTSDERAALEAAQARRRAVRHWRRYQAVLLRADGVTVAEIARALRCTQTSVYNWTAAWREGGLAGVAEGVHPGQARRLDAEAEALLAALLTANDPQAQGYAATGWTVPRHAHRAGQAGLGGGRADDPPHAASPRLALEATQVRAGPARSGLRREKSPGGAGSRDGGGRRGSVVR